MTFSYRELHAEEFPPPLLEIPQPPKQLFLAGQLPGEDTIFLTVVGARKHSPYGKEVCEELISGLAGYPITIISGLALGIDAIAHTSAMRAGLHTLAVPGSGLDPHVLYPRSHVRLADEILKNGGSLLSEFDPMTPAAPWTFPQRNRIMAGLAKATLVIEAQEQSGTLITARMALDYNRDVLAVPGSIFSLLSAGPNRLIATGAGAVRSSVDIIEALGLMTQDSEEQLTLDLNTLSEEEQKVFAALDRPLRRDHLIAAIGMSVTEGNILLMKMEIAGLIKDSPEGVRRG